MVAMYIILYLFFVVVFYGFATNYGFKLKPNKLKVISTLIFAVVLLLTIILMALGLCN